MSGNFVIYLIGYLIAIVGVAYGLSAAGVPSEWVIAALLILVGLGIVYALSRSQRDQATHPKNDRTTGPADSPNDTAETRPHHGPER